MSSAIGVPLAEIKIYIAKVFLRTDFMPLFIKGEQRAKLQKNPFGTTSSLIRAVFTLGDRYIILNESSILFGTRVKLIIKYGDKSVSVDFKEIILAPLVSGNNKTYRNPEYIEQGVRWGAVTFTF